MAKRNGSAKFMDSIRQPKLTDVICTVTTAEGKTEAVRVTIARNKVNQLNGNGLTAHNCYELSKTGKTQSADIYGNTFVYELAAATENVSSKDAPVNSETASPLDPDNISLRPEGA